MRHVLLRIPQPGRGPHHGRAIGTKVPIRDATRQARTTGTGESTSTRPSAYASTVTGPTGPASTQAGPTGATGASPSARSYPNGSFTIAQTNGLQTALNSKQSNVYTIPNTGNSWILLGNLVTSQGGYTTRLSIASNSGYSGQPWTEIKGELQFTTTDGTQSWQLGADSTPFYEAATLVSSTLLNSTGIAIQQVSSTSYNFYLLIFCSPILKQFKCFIFAIIFIYYNSAFFKT